MRAALYLRVSTVKQAEKDLSIPDQRRQAEEYCKAKGWSIVVEYVEPGASATDDKRPQFQKMISAASHAGRPFDVVVIHSLSRFFRDTFQFEFYYRKLRKHGVQLESITQTMSDDPAGDMIRKVFSMFDEYSSRETAKHVLRAMKENARQGFWNGAKPPFGYKTVIAEWRGDRAKKKLEIEPSQAEIIQLIFRLYTYGDGATGPLGIKSICTYMNDRNITYVRGRRFSIQTISKILNRTTYIGKHYFNRNDSRLKKPKRRSEWIALECPAIIDEAIFNKVQARLKHNNPKTTPPRIVNSPVLLTGLATCGRCGALMRLRTGKSGKYRYYTCSKAVYVGSTMCRGLSIPMPKLDGIVIEQLEQRIFQPDRLSNMLHSLAKRAASNDTQIKADLTQLKREQREIERKLDNLYTAIEEGTVTLNKRLSKRIEALEQSFETQRRLILSKEAVITQPTKVLNQARIETFANAMRERLHDKNPQFRKAYLRLFVGNVEVREDQITISGPKDALMQQAIQQDQTNKDLVPTFEQEWCTRQESNL